MAVEVWTLPPPPGFQGLREDVPLTVYVRHLPHWRQNGATYFITFRLADSLPQQKLAKLAQLRSAWEKSHPPPHTKESLEKLALQTAERIEHWLDQGMGSCILKDPSLAAHLTEAMHHFDGIRYELGAFIVMPNHAHVILRPTAPEEHQLEQLIGSWKQFSASKINKRSGRRGELWQDEAYDRIIRDGEHLGECLQYMGRNPELAGLPRESCPLWIRPEWEALGWRTLDWDKSRLNVDRANVERT